VTRLSPVGLPGHVALPGYDRAATQIGIVHFGLGAFTRAHQAWYTDAAMERDGGDWLIAGVSLRSADVAAQLNPQGGLYTLAQKSGAGIDLRVIGSVAEVIVASHDAARIVDLLAAPATRIVTFTITEKGYCRATDGSLDHALAGEGSVYRFLRDGLARRRAAGTPGLTLLSCDNLADNGHQLKRLLADYLAAHDPALGTWTMQHCTFPCSMVDRIVPATTEADRAEVEATLGLRDEGVVVTEPFSQWVIEDAFAGARPAWEHVGAQIVRDVAPYETAKLRMLNGAHSALAYLGLRAGHTYVHEAVRDPALRALALRLMLQEAAPTIAPAPGLDLADYAQSLIERFENPALGHRLIQIAMDGSQKIPQRWLATLGENQREERQCPAILTAIGAWLAHIGGANSAKWGKVDDPRADELAHAWERGGIKAIFATDGLIPSDWQPTVADFAAIADSMAA